MSDGATYGRVFAELYNRRWARFSERAAPIHRR